MRSNDTIKRSFVFHRRNRKQSKFTLFSGEYMAINGSSLVFHWCGFRDKLDFIVENCDKSVCLIFNYNLKCKSSAKPLSCYRSSHPEVFCAGGACNFIKKETLAQVFSCEFCEISKNTFFYRTPLVAAFGAIICFICLLYLNKEQM